MHPEELLLNPIRTMSTSILWIMSSTANYGESFNMTYIDRIIMKCFFLGERTSCQLLKLSTRAAASSCTTLPKKPDLIHEPMSLQPFVN